MHDKMSSDRPPGAGDRLLKGNAPTAEAIHAPSFCGAEVGFYLAVEERATGSLLSLGIPSSWATSPLTSTHEATPQLDEASESPGCSWGHPRAQGRTRFQRRGRGFRHDSCSLRECQGPGKSPPHGHCRVNWVMG